MGRTEASKQEWKSLEGTWDVQSSKKNEMDVPVPGEGVQLVLCNGKYTVKQGGRELGSGTVTIDPTKAPKTMDLAEGEKGLWTYPCIYKIEDDKGDTLTIARANPGEARPKDFSSKGCRVFVFKKKG